MSEPDSERLTHDELRMLDRLERDLVASDATLAAQFARFGSLHIGPVRVTASSLRLIRTILVPLFMIVGLLVVLLASALKSPLLVMGGAVAIVVALGVAACRLPASSG